MYIYKCVRIYKILLPFFFRLLIPYFGVALKFPSTFSFHFSRLFHSFFFFLLWSSSCATRATAVLLSRFNVHDTWLLALSFSFFFFNIFCLCWNLHIHI